MDDNSLKQEKESVDQRIASERQLSSDFSGYVAVPSANQDGFFTALFRNRFFLPIVVVAVIVLMGTAVFAVVSHSNEGEEIPNETSQTDQNSTDGSSVASDESQTPDADDSDDAVTGDDANLSDDGYTNDLEKDEGDVDSSEPENNQDPDATPVAPVSNPWGVTPKPPTVTQPTTPPAVPPVASSGATVSKLLVFIFENHSYKQAVAGMPYTYGEGQKYGYASNFKSISSKASLINYIAIGGGSRYGVTSNTAARNLNGTTVFGQAIAKGKTALVYSEGIPSNCASKNGGKRYAVKHNPWPYFVNERSMCQKYNVPITNLQTAISAGNLPKISLAVPDMCNSGHDCKDLRKSSDVWLKGWMEKIYAGPDWKSGKLAVVMTFDEDDNVSGDHILTTVMHPSLKNKVVTQPLTLYSLSRMYSEMSGSAPLLEASKAPSMSSAFGLRLQP
jgi:hypothetical protein